MAVDPCDMRSVGRGVPDEAWEGECCPGCRCVCCSFRCCRRCCCHSLAGASNSFWASCFSAWLGEDPSSCCCLVAAASSFESTMLGSSKSMAPGGVEGSSKWRATEEEHCSEAGRYQRLRGVVAYSLVSFVSDGTSPVKPESDGALRARGKGAGAKCKGDERKQITGAVSALLYGKITTIWGYVHMIHTMLSALLHGKVSTPATCVHNIYG